LQDKGIKKILNVAAKEVPVYYPDDFKYQQHYIEDDEEQSLEEIFDDALEFIRTKISLFITASRFWYIKQRSSVCPLRRWYQSLDFICSGVVRIST
jgi:hypothetical protein